MLILCCVKTVFAQGTAFTYQGRLTSGTNVANGVYDFTFSLFAVSSGGSAIAGPVTNSTVGVTNGLFTTTLDLGANFPGADRWLEIGVRSNATGGFTTLGPRQKLTATPYAITASNLTGGGTGLTNVNAATLNGLASSSFWQLGGNNVSGGQFLGSANNQPVTIKVNGIQALQISPTVDDGNHSGIVNIVSGSPVNNIAPGVYGAVIAGGGAQNHSGYAPNLVSADFGVIGGGYANTIQPSAASSTIGGGAQNTIQTSATHATIGGGTFNSVQTGATRATIGGGAVNTNGGAYATLSGGYSNTIQGSASYSTIGGGQHNTVQSGAGTATIGGGRQNTVSGLYATVPGGDHNWAAGASSFAAGHYAKANHLGTFVWADSFEDADFASTASQQFLIRARAGVGINTNNPFTAALNVNGNVTVNGTVTGTAFSGSGSGLTGVAPASGSANYIQNQTAVDQAAGFRINGNGIFNGGSVGIGVTSPQNKLEVGPLIGGVSGYGIAAASQHYGMNLQVNTTTGYGLLIDDYTDGGNAAMILVRNTSPVFGLQPMFSVQANGQVYAVAFNPGSDRNSKENFRTVSPASVLDKVLSLPITEWNFKTDAGAKHLGPMAQDFYSAFGLGTDDKHIATVDADGVALAAIQGLNQKLEAENAVLRARLEKLERFMTEKNGGTK